MTHVGYVRRISPATLAELRADPELFAELTQDHREEDAEAVRHQKLLELGTSWHGIHYLLTGAPRGGPPPLDFLLDGLWFGGALGDQWGEPLLHEPPNVRRIARALRALPRDQVALRFDGGTMMQLDIYPHAWSNDTADVGTRLLDDLDRLRSFVHHTASIGDGLLVYRRYLEVADVSPR